MSPNANTNTQQHNQSHESTLEDILGMKRNAVHMSADSNQNFAGSYEEKGMMKSKKHRFFTHIVRMTSRNKSFVKILILILITFVFLVYQSRHFKGEINLIGLEDNDNVRIAKINDTTQYNTTKEAVGSEQKASGSCLTTERVEEKFISNQVDAISSKNIWQTSLSKTLPLPAHCPVKTWIFHNPSWTRHHLDDGEVEEFMKENLEEYLYKSYSCLPLGVMKADMFRYAVVYSHGGVYVDLDVKTNDKVEKWWDLETCDAVIAMENDVHFCQWTFAAKKNHPILKHVLDAVADHIRRDGGVKIRKNPHSVHHYTGPGAFTEGVRRFLRERGLPGVGETTTADEMRSLYRKYNRANPHAKAEQFQNLCLYWEEYFKEIYATNLFFSLKYEHLDNPFYKSWTKERANVESTSCVIPEKNTKVDSIPWQK